MIVSYFQAGRICDYIQSRWGADKLLDMVHSFAQLKTTPEVIQENLGMSAEEFDKQFMDWLYKQDGTAVDEFRRVARRTESNSSSSTRDKNYDEVIKEGAEVTRLYPRLRL